MKSIVNKLLRTKFLVMIILKIVIDPFFLYYLSPMYSYLGSGASPNFAKYVFSWIILISFVLLDGKVNKGDISFFTDMFFYLSIIPTVSIWWIKNENITAMILIFLFWFVFILGAVVITNSKGYYSGRLCCMKEKKADTTFNILFVWLIFSTLFFSYRYGDFRLFIDFNDVYDYRLDTSNYMSSFEAYVFAWNTNIFLPLCLAWKIHLKKFMQSGVVCVLFLLSYSIYGSKGIFFSLLSVIGVWILNKFRVVYYTETAIGCFLIVSVLLSIICVEGNITKVFGALLYRLLFIPAEAHFYYFDFFQTNELLYLRQSILRFFGTSPYEKEVSVLIGSDPKYTLIGTYINLNNGLFSDAYSNFGVFGALLYPIFIILTIYFVEKNFKRFDVDIRYSIYIGMAMFFISAPFFTSLLTGGVIVLILFCGFLKKIVN